MRIMLDTNVLISIALFKGRDLGLMLNRICESHQLVLSSYVVDEIYGVVRRKWPAQIAALDRFFSAIPFEMEHTPEILPEHNWFHIRDANDEKVLYSAITADVDILITGDKDFAEIDIEKPEIMTPRDYMKQYG